MYLAVPMHGMVRATSNSRLHASLAPTRWCVDLFQASVAASHTNSLLSHSHGLIDIKLCKIAGQLPGDLHKMIAKIQREWILIQAAQKEICIHFVLCAELQTQISELEQKYMMDSQTFVATFAVSSNQ